MVGVDASSVDIAFSNESLGEVLRYLGLAHNHYGKAPGCDLSPLEFALFQGGIIFKFHAMSCFLGVSTFICHDCNRPHLKQALLANNLLDSSVEICRQIPAMTSLGNVLVEL